MAIFYLYFAKFSDTKGGGRMPLGHYPLWIMKKILVGSAPHPIFKIFLNPCLLLWFYPRYPQ